MICNVKRLLKDSFCVWVHFGRLLCVSCVPCHDSQNVIPTLVACHHMSRNSMELYIRRHRMLLLYIDDNNTPNNVWDYIIAFPTHFPSIVSIYSVYSTKEYGFVMIFTTVVGAPKQYQKRTLEWKGESSQNEGSININFPTKLRNKYFSQSILVTTGTWNYLRTRESPVTRERRVVDEPIHCCQLLFIHQKVF